MPILFFELLHIWSLSLLEHTLKIFLATLDTKHNQGQFCLPGNCNIFGTLSGYLIKTGSVCQMDVDIPFISKTAE